MCNLRKIGSGSEASSILQPTAKTNMALENIVG
jgi:hypothetical protein